MEGEWDKSLHFKTCTTVLVMSLSSASVVHHVQRCSVTTRQGARLARFTKYSTLYSAVATCTTTSTTGNKKY